ncbi:MAG TPA: class I SAM-dependent methyltransferase [Candidatus Didemnitutus sp.]|nr:class I SAM-dependent methyltransferase [Candidatus Didemnitutus sp.]
MPSLLPLPPPAPSGAAVAPGRTFDETCRLFDLDPGGLKGRCVLEVAAGWSSFAAEACRRGVDAVAVDPTYQNAPHALAEQVKRELERDEFSGESRDPFGAGGRVDRLERRAAAQRFLADYETSARRGRYLRGNLPALPFLDGAFDVVICARLFSGRSDAADLAAMVDGCAELVRVTTGDVRILAGVARLHPDANRLRRLLAERDLLVRLQTAGPAKILVLARGDHRSSMAA